MSQRSNALNRLVPKSVYRHSPQETTKHRTEKKVWKIPRMTWDAKAAAVVWLRGKTELTHNDHRMWAAIFFLKDQDFQIEMEHARYSLYSLTTAASRVCKEEEKNQAKKWNKNYRFDYFQGTTQHAYYSGAAAVLGANCANSISEIEAINFKKGLETRMVLLPFGLASQKLFHTTTQNTMMVFVLHQT